MTKKLTSLIGAILAMSLLATACGGSDSAGSDQALIDAISTQIEAEGDAPAGMDVDCMAKAIVDGFGGAEAMEADFGLTAESIAGGDSPDSVELPKEQALSLASGAMECGLGDSMISEMVGDGMSEDEAKCLLDELDQDVLRDMMATEFMSDADAIEVENAAETALVGSMFGAIANCDIDPSSLGF